MKVKSEGNGKRVADGQLQVLKENFELKAVSTVKATPDEILTALKDPVSRKLWDSGCLQCTKKAENEFEVRYENYSESIVIHTFGDKTQPQGPHFIQEHVNG